MWHQCPPTFNILMARRRTQLGVGGAAVRSLCYLRYKNCQPGCSRGRTVSLFLSKRRGKRVSRISRCIEQYRRLDTGRANGNAGHFCLGVVPREDSRLARRKGIPALTLLCSSKLNQRTPKLATNLSYASQNGAPKAPGNPP